MIAFRSVSEVNTGSRETMTVDGFPVSGKDVN